MSLQYTSLYHIWTQFKRKNFFLESLLIDPFYLNNPLPSTIEKDDYETVNYRFQKILKHYKSENRSLEFTEEQILVRSTLANLEICQAYLREDKAIFENNINICTHNLYDLQAISAILKKLDTITIKYKEIERNINNLERSLGVNNIKNYLRNLFKIIFHKIETERSTLDMSDAELSMQASDTSTLQTRLDEEIKKTEPGLEICLSDLKSLQRTLFSSDASLHAKESAGKHKIQEKEKVAKQHLRSINNLEENIVQLQTELTSIIQATDLAKQQLSEMKGDLKSDIEALIRLHKLMESLNTDVATKIKLYREELETLEAERLRILNDDTLTEEVKLQLMAELDNKISRLKECHASILSMLEKRQSELSSEVVKHTESLDLQKSELEDKLAQLEASKVGKTPSEIALIDAEMNELMNSVDRDDAPQKTQSEEMQNEQEVEEELEDEELEDEEKQENAMKDENETKDDRRDKDQEKRPAITVSTVPIPRNVALWMDTWGDYYINEDGEKIYIRECFTDEIGRYYIDPNGNKIYKDGPYGKEFIMENGELVPKKSHSSGSSTSSSSSGDSDGMSGNIDYIKANLGHPLRLALAAVFIHRPADPIDFIANYLIKYRYNELNNMVKRIEMQQLLNECEQMSVDGHTDSQGSDKCNPCTAAFREDY